MIDFLGLTRIMTNQIGSQSPNVIRVMTACRTWFTRGTISIVTASGDRYTTRHPRRTWAWIICSNSRSDIMIQTRPFYLPLPDEPEPEPLDEDRVETPLPGLPPDLPPGTPWVEVMDRPEPLPPEGAGPASVETPPDWPRVGRGPASVETP